MQTNSPIKVFIGSTPSEWLPAKVLEYSIATRSSLPVEVARLCDSKISIPTPSHPKNRSRTPFSFQRFLIPELCGFAGRAIYLDADMLVFKDIAELWRLDLQNKSIQTVQSPHKDLRPQFSVMLLDNSSLNWKIGEIIKGLDSNLYSYDELMYEMKLIGSIGREIAASWNSLESFSPGVTSLLHYTDMPKQPWVSVGNVHGELWLNELVSAVQQRFISIKDIETQINLGYIRPSLMLELNGSLKGFDRPSFANLLKTDKNFRPPYKAYTASALRRVAGKIKQWVVAK